MTILFSMAAVLVLYVSPIECNGSLWTSRHGTGNADSALSSSKTSPDSGAQSNAAAVTHTSPSPWDPITAPVHEFQKRIQASVNAFEFRDIARSPNGRTTLTSKSKSKSKSKSTITFKTELNNFEELAEVQRKQGHENHDYYNEEDLEAISHRRRTTKTSFRAPLRLLRSFVLVLLMKIVVDLEAIYTAHRRRWRSAKTGFYARLRRLQSLILVLLIKLVVQYELEALVLQHLPRPVLINIIAICLERDTRPKVVRVVRTELDQRRRLAVIGQEHNYQFSDWIQRATRNSTGKDDYQFGDISRAVL
jgi:hypothetical protein